MATLAAVILKDDKKADGTWNVKIRLSHKPWPVYIPTIYFVDKDQINKKFKIKDTFLIDNKINPLLRRYREAIHDMGEAVKYLTSNEIKDRLNRLDHDQYSNKSSSGQASNDINFIKFSRDHIANLVKSGKSGSAKNFATVVNSLQDYFKSENVPITAIRYDFLKEYEKYLRSERVYIRKNHGGREREYTQKPVGDGGLHSHMRDLRLLFNEARKHYNDEDLGIIRILHYPFRKYKVGSAPVTEHRDRSVEELLKIRDVPTVSFEDDLEIKKEIREKLKLDADYLDDRKYIVSGSRAELSRDLFMLSFYMCGMNAADIYELSSNFKERIQYNRAKTRNKRKDKAFISVKVVDEARPLLLKYAGELQKRYSDVAGLNKAIDIGLKLVSAATGIPDIDFYDARHSVGTLARNVCGFSTEQVAIALNQKERTVTDIYIAPDWSIVDRVQSGVISLLAIKPAL